MIMFPYFKKETKLLDVTEDYLRDRKDGKCKEKKKKKKGKVNQHFLRPFLWPD